MAVLAEDTFTGTNETTLSGRTPTGTVPGSGWNAASGSLSDWWIQSNTIQRMTGSDWTHEVARLAKAGGYPADYEVTVAMTFDGSLSSVACWGLRIRQGESGLSGYGVVYQGWVDQWVLHKGDFDVGGSVLDTWSDTPDGATRTVRLKAEGTKIEVYIDDVLRLEVTDSTYSDAGQPAIHVFGEGIGPSHVQFDNFQALSLTPTGTEHSPADLGVASALATTSLTQVHVLTPAALTVAATLGTTSIAQAGEFAPDDLAVSATLTPATITQTHVLSPADLAGSVTLDTTSVADEDPPQTLAGDDFTTGSEDDNLGGRTPSGPNVGDATTWEAIMGPNGGFKITGEEDSIAYRNGEFNAVLQVLNRTGGYPDDGQASIDVQFQLATIDYAIGVIMRVGATGIATGYCLVVYHTALFEGVRLMRGNGLSTWDWDVIDEWAVTHPVNTTWNLRLTIEGESLNGYVNDVLRVSATDNEYAAGRSGVVALSGVDHYNYGIHLTNFLAESLAGAETVLSPADMGVVASLEAASLSQDHVLSPSDLGVAASLEGAVVSQDQTLIPADLGVATGLEPSTLAQDHALTPAGLAVSVALEEAGIAQGHVLSPADLSVAVSLGTTSVAQAGELAPADLSVAASLEAATLSQTHVLSPADLSVATGLEATAIAQAGDLSPVDLGVTATLEGTTLEQVHQLAPDDLAVSASLEGAALVLAGELDPADMAVAALLEEVALSQVHVLSPEDVGVGAALEAGSITSDAYSLSPADMGVGALLEVPEFGQDHGLWPADVGVVAVLDLATVGQDHQLSAADLAVMASLTMTAIGGIPTPPYRGTLSVTSRAGSVTVTSRRASMTVTDA